MKLEETRISEVLLIEPEVFGDERGFFMELYQAARYAEHGIRDTFVQDNLSSSRRGIVRGLHLQCPDDQAKLVYVLQGEVFDVAVDVRVGSPTFGQWVGATLSAESRHQLYIPRGFAHGFCVTSDTALFGYKCSEVYAADSELTIQVHDPAIAIDWPVGDMQLSPRDAAAPRLRDVPVSRLPVFAPAAGCT